MPLRTILFELAYGIWVFLLSLLLLLTQTPATPVQGQTAAGWTTYSNVSRTLTRSRHQAIVVDQTGRVHVFWAEAFDPNTPEGTGDTIMYAYKTGEKWSNPIDVLLPIDGPIVGEIRAVIDDNSWLHLVWAGGYGSELYHAAVAAWDAYSARSWTLPAPLDTGKTYTHDLVIGTGGSLHIAFISSVDWQVYYTRSDNGGRSWIRPIQVSTTVGKKATSDVQLNVDPRGRIHVVWQEVPLPDGWPTLTVLYARSEDNGASWTLPLIVDQKDSRYRQDYGPGLIGIGVVGPDQVHLVWNGAPIGYRTHQWSSDGGLSWSTPSEIADRGLEFRFFSGPPVLLGDNTGALHLVTSTQRLMHATWREGRWSAPVGLPEHHSCLNPRGVIGLGNKLHVVCFDDSDHEVWYYSKEIPAAEIKPKPYPLPVTPTAVPPGIASTVVQERTGTPTTISNTSKISEVLDRGLIGQKAQTLPNSSWPIMSGVFFAFVTVVMVFLTSVRRRQK
jgi:hypothetical protein